MPTSEVNSIAPIIREVMRLQPKSVLDLGAGCGKYGALLREYLDGAHGRIHPADWQTMLVAVEGFEKYVTDLHRAVYDFVYVEDFAANADRYTHYGVVLMIDSFEHLERETGLKVLDTLLANNKHVIVSVPMGANFLPQGAVFGNDYESHRTNWDSKTFYDRGASLIHDQVCTVWSIPGNKL
jgi:2-polyprenyl-3-methyl-5-hydroxy-6-metoxy-1,4-benzoquinol methylase